MTCNCRFHVIITRLLHEVVLLHLALLFMEQKKDWYLDAVIYQIYPRSFKDANGDGIGDILGIIEKLDYIETLGVDALWISPIFPSPMEDFGYDISDYTNIEPLFGNLSDFDQMIVEAHKRDIKVILDYVPGHTSIQHPWFQESRLSRNNPKKDWYIWRYPKSDGAPPNNWLSVFGGSTWEYDKTRKQYYMHTWHKTQVDLNWRNEEVQKIMLDVLRFWLDRGVDGFRVDAFEHMMKNPDAGDLPLNPQYNAEKDNPYDMYLPIYTRHQPELQDIVKLYSGVLKEYGNKFFVTESWGELPYLMALYSAGEKFHAPFNFHFLQMDWKAEIFQSFVNEFDEMVGSTHLPTYVLGNHDRSRVATRIGKEQARVAAMLQLTLRGMPTIYNGEELGMEDVSIPQDKIQDPFEKNLPGKGLGRDPQRTPLLWDGSKYAGFSTKEPWLPLSSNHKRINVRQQDKDHHSMLSLYKKLLHFRKQSDALKHGSYLSVKTDSQDIFAFTRLYGDEHLLILLNFSNKKQNFQLPYETDLIFNTFLDTKKPNTKQYTFTLRPNEGTILRIR